MRKCESGARPLERVFQPLQTGGGKAFGGGEREE